MCRPSSASAEKPGPPPTCFPVRMSCFLNNNIALLKYPVVKDQSIAMHSLFAVSTQH